MSRETDTSWFDIPRKTPEVEVNMGRTAVLFTYENTTIYTYHEPYAHMSHVYRKEKDSNRIIFDSPLLIEELQEWHYPEVKAAYPTPGDLEHYITFMTATIAKGLGELSDS